MSRLLLEHTNQRVLPPDYRGPVLLWDIDKTYLETHFSTWRGLLRIPFELAIDKQSIPGSVPLLRALRRGAGPEPAFTPLYFVSASPPQLRKVLERRMLFDGVQFDGVTFKDQLGLLARGRVGGLRRQVGYKLTALLLYRKAVPSGARWWCFGDDVEADAEIFALFGKVCAGLRGEPLRRRLEADGVSDRDVKNVMNLCGEIDVGDDPVEEIYIHLARGSDPARFADPRVAPTRSYLQSALVLAHRGHIRPEAVASVAADMRRRHIPESQIGDHLRDAVARFQVPVELVHWARS